MKTIFLNFFLIAGILANNPYPHNAGYPNSNNCDNYLCEPYTRDMNRQNQPNPSHHTPREIVVNSNSDFAFKFFRVVSSNGAQRHHTGKQNIVFSPMCISSSFAMLSLGARATTLDQILRGLNFSPSEIQEKMIHEGFHDLIYTLNNGGSGLQVDMGSCLFVQNKLHPQPQFLSGLRNIYGGDIYMENFKNTIETEQHINKYVERKTHGKISKLVDEVDPITEILLVSYIYMKAKWEKPFNPEYTELRDFYVDPYTVVKVPMMIQTGMFEHGYDKERSCTVLKLPYKGHASAYFILPDQGKMEKVSRSLDHLAQHSLKDIMYTMGVIDVFTDRADLSGITGQPQHRLSGALHKAMMVIDERGTEAAAASSMDLVPMSMPTVIMFNTPYLVLIMDENHSILFMAKILNPAEK
uniref:Thyroxine-binding globulin n=1 Tax=Varanus komodoensis TaxID=61221 RepID=A0A8D2KSG8_VARKO